MLLIRVQSLETPIRFIFIDAVLTLAKEAVVSVASSNSRDMMTVTKITAIMLDGTSYRTSRLMQIVSDKLLSIRFVGGEPAEILGWDSGQHGLCVLVQTP